MSLKDLAQKSEEKVEKKTPAPYTIPSKDASDTSKSALLDAVLKNKKEESEPEPIIEKIPEVVVPTITEEKEETPVVAPIVEEKIPEIPSFVITEDIPFIHCSRN
jgi:hypothetical protein